jgi:plasmid maintenance system antidote protein VapI
MDKDEQSNYLALLSERVLLLLKNSGLTITGLSEITNISESHIYALINGNRTLTETIANQLGRPFKLQGWQLIRLDYEIPNNFDKVANLINFRKEFTGNFEYFSETKNNTKTSYFIEYEFLKYPIFNQPVYLWEIIENLNSIEKQYPSKELSQILHYLVTKNKLVSEKRPLKLRNGGFGSRIVDVFFRK